MERWTNQLMSTGPLQAGRGECRGEREGLSAFGVVQELLQARAKGRRQLGQPGGVHQTYFQEIAQMGAVLVAEGGQGLAHVFARVGDLAGEGAGGDGGRRSKEDLGFFVTHAAGEVPVGRADTFHRRIHAAKGVDRAAEAGGAAGVFGHLHAGVDEDFPDGVSSPPGGLQVMDDLWCGGHTEGVDSDAFAAEHAGEFQEVAGLAAGAGADVSAVEFDVAEFFGELALAGVGMATAAKALVTVGPVAQSWRCHNRFPEATSKHSTCSRS